jgi:hypothetical protein
MADELFKTSSIALAAFLMERGQARLGARRQGGTVYFTFGDFDVCRELERQFVYERPTAVIRDFLINMNELRDTLRELHGPGPLHERR